MFPSWHFILFMIFLDLVFGSSPEINNQTHDVIEKHAKSAPGKGEEKVMKRQRNEKPGAFHWKTNQEVSAEEDEDNVNNNDEYSEEANSKYEGDESAKRSLQTGDTFTPMEFLPIATKLLAKVNPGEGRGIVTGCKTPEDLADKLFAAYFLTSRRIVELTENDLSGLDALTALAMEGEVIELRSSADSLTEKPIQSLNMNGQYIGVAGGPMRCHYKLLFKKVSPSESILRKRQKGETTSFDKILKMEKKMRPNRHLIVNHKGRKSNKDKNNSNTGVDADNNAAKEQKLKTVQKDGEQKKGIQITRQNVGKEEIKKVGQHRSKQKIKHRGNKRKRKLRSNKKSKKQRKLRKKNSKSKFTKNARDLRNQHTDPASPFTTTMKPICRWRYICQEPSNLDSCRLHTSCYDGANNEAMIDDTFVDTKDKEIKDREKSDLVMHFRKMLGISALDEEVEKIIEQHVILVKPENMKPDEKIETLDEYFNNIIMAQNAMTTTRRPGFYVESKESPYTPKFASDENSSDREVQDLKLPMIHFDSEEEQDGLRNLNGENITGPSVAMDSEDYPADNSEDHTSAENTQKYRGLVESTVPMKSSTLKSIQ